MVLAAGTALATAQDGGKYHTTGLWAGRSIQVFGSHEFRDSLAVSLGYARPDRRIRKGPVDGHLVYEAYFEFNDNAGDAEIEHPYQTGALGGLAICRWDQGKMYFDLGFGAQVQDHIGKDLPSFINTTPMLGFGWKGVDGPQNWMLGVRFLHISNAGTHKKNAGQNQLLITFMVKGF